MARGKRPADDRQRALEWVAFRALQAVEGLPDPVPDHDDEPDFLVKGNDGSLLAIEVTSFHPDAGPGGSAVTKMLALRADVLNRAAVSYQQQWPDEPVWLSAIFLDVDLANRRRIPLAAQLAGFVHDQRTAMVEDITTIRWPRLSEAGLGEVFNSILLGRLQAQKATVFNQGSVTYIHSPPELIQTRIDDKDQHRFDDYLATCRGGEVWLVIVSPHFLEVHDERVIGSTYRTRFDRAYLFDHFSLPVRLRVEPPASTP